MLVVFIFTEIERGGFQFGVEVKFKEELGDKYRGYFEILSIVYRRIFLDLMIFEVYKLLQV